MWLILLSLVYVGSRLLSLSSFPIFTDEAIYLYWSKLFVTGEGSPFLSIADGKPPLFIWLQSISLSLFSTEQFLLAGRVTAVAAGFLTLLGIYRLSRFLFQSRLSSNLAVLLYILTPFTFLYDRLALMDSLLSAGIVWSLYFFWKYIRTLSMPFAFFAAMSLFLTYLTKPAGILILGIWLLIVLIEGWGKWSKRLVVGSFISLSGFVIAELLLRFSDGYAMFTTKNQEFRYGLVEIVQNGILPVINNGTTLLEWLIIYIPSVFIFLAAVGSIVLLLKKQTSGMILSGCIVAVVTVFAMTGKILFPRYILGVVPLILILAGYASALILHTKKNGVVLLLGVVLLTIGGIQSLRFQYLVVHDPVLAHYPAPDYDQFLAESPSGLALEAFYPIIDQALAQGPVEIITDGTFGLLPYAFTLRYWGNPQVTITPVYPFTGEQLPAKDIKKFMVVKAGTIVSPVLSVVVDGYDAEAEIEYRLLSR